MSKQFIQQTARDYDLSFQVVEKIYNKTKGNGNFYEKLEENINEVPKVKA